jgi:hypothetical protein
MDLPELPLTGLTRKILKRLRVMPGYSGGRPALTLDELTPDSAKEFAAAGVQR